MMKFKVKFTSGHERTFTNVVRVWHEKRKSGNVTQIIWTADDALRMAIYRDITIVSFDCEVM